MTQFTVEQMNEALSQIECSPYSKPSNAVQRIKTYDGVPQSMSSDGVQGEHNGYDDIYKTPVEGWFLKVSIETDSYDENEHITKIQVVKATQKEVTVYEYE